MSEGLLKTLEKYCSCLFLSWDLATLSGLSEQANRLKEAVEISEGMGQKLAYVTCWISKITDTSVREENYN